LALSQGFAMTPIMNVGIDAGSEFILSPRFDIGQLLNTIGVKRPTTKPGVPRPFNAINAAAMGGNSGLSSIRYCISGGAPPFRRRSRAHG